MRENKGGAIGLVLGIIALVMGVPSLLVSWVPFLCIVSLACAVVGLLVGLAGVITAAVQKRSGLAISIAGGAVNLIAVLIALVMTIFSAGMFAAVQETVTQLANAEPPGEVILGWGEAIDPDGDCTIRRQGGALTIQIPATAHDFTPEQGLTNAPRVVQEVTGDFRVQVKVCGTLRPTADGTVPGHTPFQSGGLLLWSDRDNYVRLERAALNRDGFVQPFVSLEYHQGGQMMLPQGVPILEQDLYLRLERRGEQLIGSYSTDGQEWTKLQPIVPNYPAKVRVGVEAVNAVEQPLVVRFEDWKIDKK